MTVTGIACVAILMLGQAYAAASTQIVTFDPADWTENGLTVEMPDRLDAADASQRIRVTRPGYGTIEMQAQSLAMVDAAGETIDETYVSSGARAESSKQSIEMVPVHTYGSAYGANVYEVFEQRPAALKRDTVLGQQPAGLDAAHTVRVRTTLHLPNNGWRIEQHAEPNPLGGYVPARIVTSHSTAGGGMDLLDPNGVAIYTLRPVVAIAADGTIINGYYDIRIDPADASVVHLEQVIAANALVGAAYPVRIDPTVTINATSGGGNAIPVRWTLAGNYNQCVYQQSYPANLLQAGRITEFSYQYDDPMAGEGYSRIELFLGETSRTSNSGSFSSNGDIVSMQKVYDGPYAITCPNLGFSMITLDTSFNYSGNNNLLVEIRLHSIATSSSNGNVRSNSAVSGCFRAYAWNNPTTDAASSGGTYSLGGQFEIELLGIDTPMSTTLPDAYNGEAYQQIFTAAGSPAPYTWSATGQPTGLTMTTVNDEGDLAGTVNDTVGSYSIDVEVSAAAGTASDTFTLEVFDMPTVTEMVDEAIVDIAVSGVTFAATGGKAPLTWSATGLPTGVSVDPNTGAVTGTPTVAGPASVVVTVTDANGKTDDWSFTWTVRGPITITQSALPAATATGNYSLVVSRMGGSDGVTWSVNGLPTGLTIDPATGEINGTVALGADENSPYNVQVTATDTNAVSSQMSYQLTVNKAPVVTTMFVPLVIWDTPYTFTPVAEEGTEPYSYSTIGLPTGLTIDSVTGEISGTVTNATPAQTYSATLTVTDANGVEAEADLDFTVLTEAPATSDCTASVGEAGLPAWISLALLALTLLTLVGLRTRLS